LDTVDLYRGYSLNILIRMLLVGMIVAALAVWKHGLINEIYLHNQLTTLGLATNGFILFLFAAGLVAMVASFMHYAREERALGHFVNSLKKQPKDPLAGVRRTSVIYRRVRTLARLSESHSPINQGALASALVADESTRVSFPKFINNILILTGVFGTILGLALALVGASGMLASAVNTGGMGMVVHGMSTALSTTITAILCYLYFGYFYLKLNDAQTRFISSIEQVTMHLLPRFEVREDGVINRVAGLVKSISRLVECMELSQRGFEGLQVNLLNTLVTYRDKVQEIGGDIKRIEEILRDGFRLPPEPER
jgi:MotA/TolQ/ExbB proton channel family